MTQTKPGTWFKFYLLVGVAGCITTAKSNMSTISESLPAAFLHELFQSFPIDCHMVMQGSFGEDILEILHSQRPLLLLETTDGLDIGSGKVRCISPWKVV